MKIAMRSLAIEGLGPFRERVEYAFANGSPTFVLGKNSHGKTPTIDLVRWLLAGEAAYNDFCSLRPNELLNWDTYYDGGQGEVVAEFEVQGRGVFRARRSVSKNKPGSKLTFERWDDETSQFLAEGGGESALRQLFPIERIGFNLLTGEHIERFQDQLNGDLVKRSMEKLLQVPQLAIAARSLGRLTDETAMEAERAKKQGEKASAASDAAAARRKDLALLKNRISEIDEKLDGLKRQEASLNKEIGALKSASDAKDEIARLDRDLRNFESQKEDVLRDINTLVDNAWRPIAALAGWPEVRAYLKAKEQYEKRREAYGKSLGQIELFTKTLHASTCEVCLSTLDAKARKRLQAEIDRLGKEAPTPPEGPSLPEATLRDWNYAGLRDVQNLLKKLQDLKKQLFAAQSNHDAARKRRDELMANLDDGASSKYRSLVAKKAELGSEQAKLQGEKERKIVERQELEIQVREYESKATVRGGTTAKAKPLAKLAKDYAAAFQEAVDGALPWYRSALQDKVQDIFRSLYQKNSKARIEFQGDGYTPAIVAPDEKGKPVALAVGEGEKSRLGISLLLAFREIASEKPFLLLDAAFSAMDAEGVTQLLVQLAKTDSQVIVLTKDPFTPKQHAVVAGMKPSVYVMDWRLTPGSKRTQGYTTLRQGRLPDLLMPDTGGKK